MSTTNQVLPSWRPGATRDAVLAFLERAQALPRSERLACFDNDGTLWVERPHYVQLEFFLDALARKVGTNPEVAERPEYAALLNRDLEAIGELGLPRIGLALTELFERMDPDRFSRLVRDFTATAQHPSLDRLLKAAVYQPMLELIDELRRREFTVSVVTGGGTEFVRAISEELYGVPPELVVGTLIEYDAVQEEGKPPSLRRSARVVGGANEGAVKLINIQTQLGRRPVLGAGNTDGDREMLEWASTGDGPGMALLLDHDDAEREFSYSGHSASLGEREPILATAERLGWTVVSMARDWERVFPDR